SGRRTGKLEERAGKVISHGTSRHAGFGRIVDIEVRSLAPPPGVEDLADLFGVIRRRPYAMLLLSGGDLDCAGYSLLGWDPFLVLKSKGDQVSWRLSGETRVCQGNPLTVLEDALGGLELPGGTPVDPLAAGCLGFLAYDLKNHLEILPQTAADDLNLPDLVMAFPRRLVVHDRRGGQFREVRVIHEDARGRRPEGANEAVLWGAAAEPPGPYQVGTLTSNFSREAYLAAIRRIRDYIRQGDVYQVNLAQRFSFPFAGEAYTLFRRLFQLNPAPFYAFLNCGDFRVLSTSMERFLCRRGDYLETRPIKGTRPRGATAGEDAALSRELEDSPKDDAELSMIVDLLRNDLGKVCEPRTVRVAEHKRLEAYQNVYHLVSIITGQVRPGVTAADILRATFPGGSITGCPKIRAMEIIDELEPEKRGVYAGCIGYFAANGEMDTCIALRTAIIKDGTMYVQAGAGIVADSIPQSEQAECENKARALFRAAEEAVRFAGQAARGQ
ncbi:MAG: aminodeoxychorismate synthase component I, partial [Rhodomicrobium sp.]